MRWDAAPLQKKLLGGIWLIFPLCLAGHAFLVTSGLIFLLPLFPKQLAPSPYPYPRKSGGAIQRIFFAGAACFFLLSCFQFALLCAGYFFFSVTPCYEILSLMIACFFAFPLGLRLLFLRIPKAPAILGGGLMILLSLLIACK